MPLELATPDDEEAHNPREKTAKQRKGKINKAYEDQSDQNVIQISYFDFDNCVSIL